MHTFQHIHGKTTWGMKSLRQGGFTLLELVMIIVLLAIVAMVAVPKIGDVTSTNVGAFEDKLRADIRYAQNLAMSQNKRYRVYFNATPPGNPLPSCNPGYGVVYDTSGGSWTATAYALDPAGKGSLSIALNTGQFAGMSFSAVGFSGNYIEFNSLGVPFDSAGALTVNKTVTISPGGTTVTVTAQTGAVN